MVQALKMPREVEPADAAVPAVLRNSEMLS